ncbi:MAG TPA: hypothetical protein VFN67_28390 [Polyangiales bacterium]|nr:hypothetical protein [Polyangiales bacterium]
MLEYRGDQKRSGSFVDAAFTRDAAAKIKKDTTFTATIAGPMYAQPLFIEGADGKPDLIITATERNEVAAVNAADGKDVWRKTLAPPQMGGLPCGNITPLGVTGTPAIDPKTRTLYVAAMVSGPEHKVFALGVDDGADKPGFPVSLEGVSGGSHTFASANHNQRGGLLILNDTLYVPFGGHFGDCAEYHGWVIGVPLAMAGAKPFGFATNAQAGGIWAPGAIASDGTSVFAATGNTMSAPLVGFSFSSPSTWGHGNAVLRLSPDLKTIAESDTKNFFAPQDWMTLDSGDLDLGGSGPVLVSVPGSTPSDFVVAMGKGGTVWLAGKDNLGGLGGELDSKKVASGGIGGGMIQAATAYNTPSGTFVAFRAVQSITGCGKGTGNIGGLKVAGSKLEVAWCAGQSGQTSVISTTTDGMANSIVWYVAGSRLMGFSGEDGSPVYNGDGAGDGMLSLEKFATMIVAKGKMYFASGNSLVRYTVQ